MGDTGNIYNLLRSHLRGTSCRAFVSDMKVKLKVANADIFYYPDILVTCDPKDSARYYKSHPKLIIEVLSESTETIDKREKRINYQSLDSLEEYILVSQDRINIEVYRKNELGEWSVRVIRKDDELFLESIDLIAIEIGRTPTIAPKCFFTTQIVIKVGFSLMMKK